MGRRASDVCVYGTAGFLFQNEIFMHTVEVYTRVILDLSKYMLYVFNVVSSDFLCFEILMP